MELASELVARKKITVCIYPHNYHYYVGRDIDRLAPLKTNGGPFDTRGLDIIKLFGNENLIHNDIVVTRSEEFDHVPSYYDIVQQEEFKEYHIVQALLIASELAKDKEALRPGEGMLIFLKQRIKGKVCHPALKIHRSLEDGGGRCMLNVAQISLEHLRVDSTRILC